MLTDDAKSTNESALLIADIHLEKNNIEKTNLFIKFCKQQATKVEQIFILGDLFNTWLGDDMSIYHYKPVIKTLQELTKTTKVFVMKGNRDFLLNKMFEQTSGCKLINSPYLLQINNKQYVLTHGDELCTKDIAYQRQKMILQHPLTKFIFVNIPKKLRQKIATKLRQTSINYKKTKTLQTMDACTDAIQELMKKYPTADLIHGHTHQKNTHIYNNFTRYVLQDWSDKNSSAIKINKTLSWIDIN